MTEIERRAFSAAITAIKQGKELESVLPDVEDTVARERFRNWVFNMVRKDLPPAPSRERDLLPLSIAFVQQTTIEDLKVTYSYYSPEHGHEKVHDLVEIARQTGRQLSELSAFIPSFMTVIANGPVAFEDVFLLPALAIGFLHNTKLLLLDIQNRPLVLISKRWWHWGISSDLSLLQPGVPMANFKEAVEEVKMLAESKGYTVETFFQPEAPWL